MNDLYLTVAFSAGRYQVYAVYRRRYKGGVGLDAVWESGVCEVGSAAARSHFSDDQSYRRWREEADRLRAVVEANQAYLLGREGVAAYLETEGDRDEARRARRRGFGD
jgi:hypothetical protein